MKRKTKLKRTKDYRDSQGITLDQVWQYLPGRVSDWPTVVRVHDDTIERQMHEWFPRCWGCGRYGVEAHHIIGGTKGRSDEYTNIAMLCGVDRVTGEEGCHAKANTNELPMWRILELKCVHDRQHTSWVRLCLLARKYLALEKLESEVSR